MTIQQQDQQIPHPAWCDAAECEADEQPVEDRFHIARRHSDVAMGLHNPWEDTRGASHPTFFNVYLERHISPLAKEVIRLYASGLSFGIGEARQLRDILAGLITATEAQR